MVQRLSQRSVELALFGAPFLWISTEVVRAYLPEISFPWALLGYPAAENPAIVQLTTIVGIYGISFLVVAFNALLIWGISSYSPGHSKSSLRILLAAIVLLLVVQLIGPTIRAHSAVVTHLARIVQPNFPENTQYAGDWYAEHKAEMADLEQLSLRPSAGSSAA